MNITIRRVCRNLLLFFSLITSFSFARGLIFINQIVEQLKLKRNLGSDELNFLLILPIDI